ncbi:unnamed protein product, partial [marine sediment metagenome]
LKVWVVNQSHWGRLKNAPNSSVAALVSRLAWS